MDTNTIGNQFSTENGVVTVTSPSGAQVILDSIEIALLCRFAALSMVGPAGQAEVTDDNILSILQKNKSFQTLSEVPNS